MLLSGENFGDKNSPQVSYLRSLQSWDHHFPGFDTKLKGLKLLTVFTTLLSLIHILEPKRQAENSVARLRLEKKKTNHKISRQ